MDGWGEVHLNREYVGAAKRERVRVALDSDAAFGEGGERGFFATFWMDAWDGMRRRWGVRVALSCDAACEKGGEGGFLPPSGWM
eukprot:362630-Chlamydomonas_euryale.AAC.7